MEKRYEHLTCDAQMRDLWQKTKTYQVKASEFGEINGNFSIKDQENLVINTMHKSLTSISRKINSMN